jgi:3-hydroxyisobutyrate dehydrogenase-like beta-hydroxyacid dehydrogenase
MTVTSFAVIGLGEAGRLYASGLAELGQEVRGFDPYTDGEIPGVTRHTDLAAALDGADIVISLVGARASAPVAQNAAAHLPAGSTFADLNTASPSTKRELAAVVSGGGARFADVAVLAPVPRAGVRTPLLASGDGADSLAAALGGLGVPIESIAGEPGDAAGRKLLRSVFMKGLAAVVLESLAAAEAAGQGEWMRDQIRAEFEGADAALRDRLVDGSRAHAARRSHEVADAVEFVRTLGTPTWSSEAAHRWLSHLDVDAQQRREEN